MDDITTKPEITLESLYGEITDKITNKITNTTNNINNSSSTDKTVDKDKEPEENYLYKIGFFILLFYIIIRTLFF